jgi:hypothetical protein
MLFFCFSSPFFMVGLNAALTYPRAVAHSMSRSRSLPIRTPDRHMVRVTPGVPTTRNDSHARIEAFHPFTHKTTSTTTDDEIGEESAQQAVLRLSDVENLK